MASNIVDSASTAMAEILSVANASIPSIVDQTGTRSQFGLFGVIVLSTLRFISNLLLQVITFVTITIPTWILWMLSTSLTITFNFTTLAILLFGTAATATYFYRYRFHNYGKLPNELQRREAEVEIFPDTQTGDTKSSRLSNYLDDFLSAIKVFGYLEKPVFHELTRTMQTRKLVAGETLNLEDEKGFCLVVEGTVQIFVRSRHEGDGEEQGSDDEGEGLRGQQQGYQLLTEVKNGAPMSSLFSILSLFTEDLEMSHEELQIAEDHVSTTANGAATPVTPERPSPLDSPSASESNQAFPNIELRRRETPQFTSPSPAAPLPRVPPMTLEPRSSPRAHAQRPSLPRTATRKQFSAHPDIVARAATDCTIAVIPASSFRRLTRAYPKSTAHIIQVILNRFYRVTLATGHQYLGLTQEILKTEKAVTRFSTCELPDFLRDTALQSLKDKFTAEREKTSAEDTKKGIALHNPRAGKRRKSNTTRRDLAAQARLQSARTKNFGAAERSLSPVMERSGISAGDLLANGRPNDSLFSQPMTGMTPAPQRIRSPLDQGYFQPLPLPLQRQESISEDEIFREQVLDCMCAAMGLTNIDAMPPPASVEASPKLVSYDSRRQKAMFSSALGLMDESSTEGDSESMISTSQSALAPLSHSNVIEDLIDEVDIVYFQQGTILVEQQERMPGLYYVIDGFLEVSIALEEDDETTSGSFGSTTNLRLNTKSTMHRAQRKVLTRTTTGSVKHTDPRQSMFLLKPGSLAGYLPAVSGFRSFVNVKAKSNVIVGFLPNASLERLTEKYPIILLTLAKRLTSLLDPLIMHIDFALEYLQVDAGGQLYDQGDQADAIYIILNGRLRAIQTREDKTIRILGEYGQGDSVGELEVLTETLRPGSLHAQRDTEIAKLPKMLFNSLAQEQPAITLKMSKILARRMRSLVEGPMGTPKERTQGAVSVNPASNLNIRTVCILPTTNGIPVAEFANRLVGALTQLGSSVMLLNQTAILTHLGRHAFSRMGKLKLAQYLADLEEKYSLVLYVADASVQSPWTTTCITQSDCILMLALADGSPEVGEYERLLLTTKTTTRKELVLIHNERLCPPGLTRRFLRNRLWVNGGHHHIQMSFKASPEPVRSPNRRLGSVIKKRVQNIQAEIQKYTGRRMRRRPIYSPDSPFKSDFHRLARKLTGKSVGLVLGGGGARGIAHVGIIRAMEEAGIPVDIVGGTSIGAFIGALYAWDASIVPMYGRVKRFAARMGSMWRFVLDLTYPSASWTTGHEFNRGIFKTFGDYLIEDFWLPYYCNTTNISQSRAEFHTSGYVWRYVRASMSLAGLLPPLTDEGSMLLDGGYIDNLTVEYMKSLGADVVFAIDVGSLYDTAPQAFGDTLSGFWTLWNSYNPFSTVPNPPSLSEIQSRLAYVSSVDTLERAKTMPGCHYMRPPIEPFGTLQFGSFDEIYRVGYDYGKSYLAKMREERTLPFMVEGEGEDKDKKLRRTTMARRASI